VVISRTRLTSGTLYVGRRQEYRLSARPFREAYLAAYFAQLLVRDCYREHKPGSGMVQSSCLRVSMDDEMPLPSASINRFNRRRAVRNEGFAGCNELSWSACGKSAVQAESVAQTHSCFLLLGTRFVMIALPRSTREEYSQSR
jgi:hypothetical protein